MNKFWRIILYFEAAGVVLALALYFLWPIANPANSQENMMITVLSVLCPGAWIMAMCIDCEVGTDPGLLFLLILLGVNAGVYAVAGAVAAALLVPAIESKP
jgi:F0F1-type ATP synthase assembly protein I